MQVSQVAAWTRTGYSGEWDEVASPYLLSHDGWNENVAYANFTYGTISSLADGQGIQVNVTITVEGNRREWWWINGVKRFFLSLGLHGTADAVYTNFYIAHEQGIVLRTSEARCGSLFQFDVGRTTPLSFGETVDTTEATYWIQIIRVNSTTAKIVYATNILERNFGELAEGSVRALTEYLTVDPSVWESPTLNLYCAHQGSGRLIARFTDPMTGAIEPIEQHPLPTTGAGDPFAWLRDGFNTLYSLIMVVGSIVTPFLPMLPMIFLLYILDVAVTSVQIGSVQPVGNFVRTLWEFLLKIWDVLVRIGQLIWDAITFWT